MNTKIFEIFLKKRIWELLMIFPGFFKTSRCLRRVHFPLLVLDDLTLALNWPVSC